MSKSKKKSRKSIFRRFFDTLKYLLIAIVLVCIGFVGYPIGVVLYGLYEFIIPVHMLKIYRSDCTEEVDARIVNFEEKVHYGGSIFQKRYYAVYEYDFDGRTYKTSSKMHYKGSREVGANVKLCVSGFNPVDIYEVEIEKRRIFDLRLKGISWVILGVALGYYLYVVNGIPHFTV